VSLTAGVDERARDRDGRTAFTCDLRSASLQHPASIDYLRYGALQICIGLQSLRFSALRCRLARRLDWNLALHQRWKICNLQTTITVHCRIAGVRSQALEIKFHNKSFASERRSQIARINTALSNYCSVLRAIHLHSTQKLSFQSWLNESERCRVVRKSATRVLAFTLSLEFAKAVCFLLSSMFRVDATMWPLLMTFESRHALRATNSDEFHCCPRQSLHCIEFFRTRGDAHVRACSGVSHARACSRVTSCVLSARW
jgi:hypothetical protein